MPASLCSAVAAQAIIVITPIKFRDSVLEVFPILRTVTAWCSERAPRRTVLVARRTQTNTGSGGLSSGLDQRLDQLMKSQPAPWLLVWKVQYRWHFPGWKCRYEGADVCCTLLITYSTHACGLCLSDFGSTHGTRSGKSQSYFFPD